MAYDGENFLTADEARVDLWNVEKKNDTVYNLVDYERRHSTFEDERITSAAFNQTSGCVFLYTTSTGKINICDMRERSDFHARPSLQLEVSFKNNGLRSHVFNKWVDCVSEAKFVAGTHQIASRDYMSVKLWDLRSATSYNSKPLYSAQVTDYMERHLPQLLENENLEDQFFLDVSPDGRYISTGGYNRSGHVMDINATTNTAISCVFRAERDSVAGKLKVYGKNKKLLTPNPEAKIEYKKRVQLGCWSPISKQAGANC